MDENEDAINILLGMGETKRERAAINIAIKCIRAVQAATSTCTSAGPGWGELDKEKLIEAPTGGK
jgi:hypothetical protein